MRTLTVLPEGVDMNVRNGQLGESTPHTHGNGREDAFCRTVVAAVAALLALKLCQYVRRLLGNSGV